MPLTRGKTMPENIIIKEKQCLIVSYIFNIKLDNIRDIRKSNFPININI